MVKVIAIAGGSASGKSTLSGMIEEVIDDSLHISLDDFFLDIEDQPDTFDDPSALDWDMAEAAMKDLYAGNSTEIPVYSFPDSARIDTEEVEPSEVIIVEGLWTLFNDTIRGLADISIFIKTPVDVRMARRIRRDTENRGVSVEKAIEYFEQAREKEKEYVDPTREHADFVIDGRPEEKHARLIASFVQ